MAASSGHAKKFKFWHDVLPHVTKRQRALIRDKYGGQSIGVDAGTIVWEFACNIDEMMYAIGHRLSYYEPSKMMRIFERIHERYLLQNIDPIYVFDGQNNPVVREYRGGEYAYTNMNKFYTVHGNPSLNNPYPVKKRIIAQAGSQIRKMKDMDPKVFRFMANWMQSLGMKVVGAPYEAHWQLVEMERQGITTGSISHHMNTVMAGAERIIINPNYREIMRGSYYKRSKDLCRSNWTHDFTKYIEYLPEFAALYGTPYNFRRSGWTTKNVFFKALPRLVGIVHDKEEFFTEARPFNQQLVDMFRLLSPPEDFIEEFHRARHHYRYAPVWRKRDGVYTIEPLNPLPEGGATWEEYLGYDPVAELPIGPEDYERATTFADRTFIDEVNINPWHIGIFPKMRAPEDVEDEGEGYLEHLKRYQKTKRPVTRPRQVEIKEPEIGW